MWAYRLSRPGCFERVDVPTPDGERLRPGEVLLRVLGGGVCGSDLPYFSGRVCPLFDDASSHAAGVPGFPLHEVAGVVVATSDPALSVGSRVVGWASGTDALAEYVVTDGDGLLAVPDAWSVREALTLQPLACVLGTLGRLGPTAGEHVAILGLGPFGLLFAHVLRERGVASVTGIDRVDRSDVAAAFRLDRVVQTSTDRWSSLVTEGEHPSLVIEAIGHQAGTVADAVRAVADGGRILCFGVPDDDYYPVPFRELFRKGATVLTGVVSNRRDCLELARDYLQRNPELDRSFVTEILPFDRVQDAFELAARPAPGRLKVLLAEVSSQGSPTRGVSNLEEKVWQSA